MVFKGYGIFNNPLNKPHICIYVRNVDFMDSVFLTAVMDGGSI